MPEYRHVTLSKPLLSDSQMKFRLGLARQRTRIYPLDSLDFIMMDLERPEGAHRHAFMFPGDLTGRLLEFLSRAEGVDGVSDERLPLLFERILAQRRPSGLFGRLIPEPPTDVEHFDTNARFFTGLMYYYELMGDKRALAAAVDLADAMVRTRDLWYRKLKETGGRNYQFWMTEPMTMLYGLTGRQECLDFTGVISRGLELPDKGAHGHGYMSTLRGLQLAALITGDEAWNEKPEAARRMIMDRHYVMPDGCAPEAFPHSYANEGCSIADWLMLNLNAGAITGSEEAYEQAERVLWNALAFNQWITGSFGCRSITPVGYGLRRSSESWWCCLHHGGLALAEYARHAVTLRDGVVTINLLVPGRFDVPLPGGGDAEVKITTGYPARADSFIEAEDLPDDIVLRLRVPSCVSRPEVAETREGGRVCLRLTGRLGHHLEPCHGGAMLKYGPLVLAPGMYDWQAREGLAGEAYVPGGYIPNPMPAGLPVLRLPPGDADGVLPLSELPTQGDFMYFEDGPGSRCGVPGSPANVDVRFPGGEERTLRFTPLCYATSNLSLFETPFIFNSSHNAPRQSSG